MSEIEMRDLSRAGRPLGSAVVRDLPSQVTLRELLRARIVAEVAAYNRAPGRLFVGLVQPDDAMRHSDGHHLPAPRQLDADGMVAAAMEAAELGLVGFQVDGQPVAGLDQPLSIDDHDQVVAILERPIVARHA